MPFLKGAANFVEFRIIGKIAGDQLNIIADRIKANAFVDIDDNYDEFSVGWVSALNMFDSEFNYDSHTFGNYVVMALRVDERKVPGATLKKMVAKEIERVKAEKQLPKLSKSAKSAIKERIRTELVRKANPTSTVAHVVWDVPAGRVLFFSTNTTMQELLQEAFDRSFNLTIESVNADSLLEEFTPQSDYESVEIGQDFLTWLWYMADENGGAVTGKGLNVGDKIQLEIFEQKKRVLCTNSEAEAREALKFGNTVEQLGLVLLLGDSEIGLNIVASTFAFKGVKLPKTPAEGDEGLVLERVGLFFTAADTVLDLFRVFVTDRVSEGWDAGTGLQIREWVASDSEE